MKPLICIAGKNQISVDLVAGCKVDQNSDVVVLPNESDDGSNGWQPSLRHFAIERGIPIVDIDWVMSQSGICFISAEYDRIVRPSRFQTTKLFNIHFSLLPKFRGCNTAIWPILLGEKEHGVTLHVIDPGVDTGPIIDQRSFFIGDRTARELYVRCMAMGSELALHWLPDLISGKLPTTPQPEAGASTYRRSDLDFSMKEIDLGQPVATVLRQIRAFTFPEYQLPTFRGRPIVRAWASVGVDRQPAGTVVPLGSREMRVWANDGALNLSFQDKNARHHR